MKRIFTYLALISLVAVGCADRANEAPIMAEKMAASTERSLEVDGGETDDLAGMKQRMVIRTANIQLISATPDEDAAAIQRIATKLGGFVVRSGTSGSAEYGTATLQLRIPATELDAALELIKEHGELSFENISGQDVTAEFVDNAARLKTQRGLESRFLVLLEKANTVDDMLRIETELARVRGVIERIEGRQNQIHAQVSMATVDVSISQEAPVSETFSEIDDAIDDAGGIMAAVIAGGIRLFAGLLPIAIVFGTFLGGLVLLLRRRKRS